MNSRHPDPRRMWKWGRRGTSWTISRSKLRGRITDQLQANYKHYNDITDQLRANYGRITVELRANYGHPQVRGATPPIKGLPIPKGVPLQLEGNPKRGYPQEWEGVRSKNDKKVKVLRIEFSIVEILSGLQESIFSLFRRPQLHSRKKSKKYRIYIKFPDFSV